MWEDDVLGSIGGYYEEQYEDIYNDPRYEEDVKEEENMKDYNKVKIDGFCDVHEWDAPDYVDAFPTSAYWEDGTELTKEELETLSNNYGEVVHEQLIKWKN